MGTELVAIKDELHSTARVQTFRDMLAPYRLPLEAWRAGFLSAFEGQTYLLNNCTLPTVINSGITIALLGLRMDRATGQSCVVPFKGKAQPIIMVQGYTVVAGRSGYTLQSRLIREGDAYREHGGSEPRIEHEPLPGNRGKAIATYAVARSKMHPTMFTPILPLDHIIAVRDRSKGYASAMNNGNPHPWQTDFEAMMLKTPKRLLAKDIPNDQLHSASWLETQHDLGNHAWLRPDGPPVIQPGEPDSPLPDRQPGVTDVEDLTQPARPPAPLVWITPDGKRLSARSIEEWSTLVSSGIGKQNDVAKLQAALDRNRAAIDAIAKDHPDHAITVTKSFNDRGVY